MIRKKMWLQHRISKRVVLRRMVLNDKGGPPNGRYHSGRGWQSYGTCCGLKTRGVRKPAAAYEITMRSGGAVGDRWLSPVTRLARDKGELHRREVSRMLKGISTPSFSPPLCLSFSTLLLLFLPPPSPLSILPHLSRPIPSLFTPEVFLSERSPRLRSCT